MGHGDRDRFHFLIVGIWLIGLAVLLEARLIWPGILFLAGATELVRAYHHPESGSVARGGVAMILVGVWAILRFSLPALMVGLGGILILTALSRPTMEAKPFVDRTLD